MFLHRILSVFLVAAAASASKAVTINTSTIISAENTYPGEPLIVERGGDSPTVVQMVDGGEAFQIILDDDSVLNFQGGFVAQTILARDQSHVNVLGGTLPSLNVRGAAVANLYNATLTGDILVSGARSPTLDVFGGDLRNVFGHSTSPLTINVHGGLIEKLGVDGGSHFVNVTGGSIGELSVHGTATFHWSGGEVRSPHSVFLNDDAVLHMYGRNLAFKSGEYITGTLLDGTSVDDYWVDVEKNSQVVFHNMPEPSAFALAATAGCVLLLSRTPRGKRALFAGLSASTSRGVPSCRILGIAIVMMFVAQVRAVTINTSTIISAENSYPGESLIVERGGESPTVVQMIDGGEVRQMGLYDDSILNFQGGTIESSLDARDRSRANIFHGSVPLTTIRGGAVASIYDGTITTDTNLVPIVDSSGSGFPTLNVYGGVMRNAFCFSSNPCTVNVHGGVIERLAVEGPGLTNITGGSLAQLSVHDGVAHWSGGEIRSPSHVFVDDGGVLNIYGRGLEFKDDDITYITGRLLDGTNLDDYYIFLDDGGSVIFHNVPEPGAFALAAIAGCVLLLSRTSRGMRALSAGLSARTSRGMLACRILSIAIAMNFAIQACAVTINTSTIISAENSYPGESLIIERGGESPTVVQMVGGGEVRQMGLFDDSILNFQGGTIESSLNVRDQSQVNVFQGSVPLTTIRGDAVANIYGGTITTNTYLQPIDFGSPNGSPTINVHGGTMRDVYCFSSNPCTLNVHGGVLDRLREEGPSLINFTGGSVTQLSVHGGVAHWSGGEIRNGRTAWVDEGGVLNIYGRNLRFRSDDFPEVRGTLLDGTSLTGYNVYVSEDSTVVFHNVPEPGSAALAITACLATFLTLRRERRLTVRQNAPAS